MLVFTGACKSSSTIKAQTPVGKPVKTRCEAVAIAKKVSILPWLTSILAEGNTVFGLLSSS
ncbi:MAG TPA: hypothetical protein VEH58_03405 [Dehalococcoidales bacterium]|nr:hypothetical protein [Dehalococcoidales bacterium]